MSEAINAAINAACWDLARQREDAYRELARDHLPGRVRWLADHPRLLRIAYRLRRKWQPTVYIGADLGVSVAIARQRDGTMIVLSEAFAHSVRRDPQNAKPSL